MCVWVVVVANSLFVYLAVRDEAERHHVTNTMSPTYKTTTTKKFSLCDNILPGTGFVEGERDPTVEWFAYHRKFLFLKKLDVQKSTHWQLSS